ncbi:MAG: DNA polymerase III subunit delta [Gemmataceae bacterium]
MDALDFIDSPPKGKLQPIYVLQGDEAFLKRESLLALRRYVFGDTSDDMGYSSHAGDKATFAEVVDELETLPFLSQRRLVAVENADPFVTKHRGLLEKYVAEPSKSGILVLDVKTWQATTKLAKAVPAAGVVLCKAPPPYKLPEWCMRWSFARQGKQIPLPAARLLVDLTGTEMGVLDQEIAKLAIYVGDGPRIEQADVDLLCGGGRSAKIFNHFDLLADKKPNEALSLLDQLFDQGEEPIRMLGAFSLQLRRLAQVARLVRLGQSLSAASDQAGIPSFPAARQGCEKQLRHLGRARVDQLYDWLLEVDLGMKGSSQLAPRTLLERLIARMA